ncbi:MAG TPA: hypothetical protein VJW94_16235 [Candidatus Acidoferrum sp.]|nr:hypothetical protein [Candidatus Acidoferrum sp.]
MKSYKAFPFLILVACLFLGSCSGLPQGTGGGGGGTANVSFVLVSNDAPAAIGLVSLKVIPTSITLTPSNGTATTFSINGGNGYSFDLVRVQSDSAYLGTVPGLTTGAYTTVAVSFLSAQLAFYNGTGVALTNPVCPAGDTCIATFAGPLTATITSTQTISGNSGFAINIDLGQAITVSGTTLSLNFANANASSIATLPRTNSNLAAGQLDLIEDFTGIVSSPGSTVTITPAPAVNRPPITATVNSSTVLDEDPTHTLCTLPTQGSVSSCVSAGQAASMDAILNSDGTFTVQEIEPLLASPTVDSVEGTVVAINSANQTQFTMVVTDIIPAATNSLIGSLTVGTPLTVNLSAGPNFYVDTKGLLVQNSFPNSYGFFIGSTNTTGMHLGQTVQVHVTTFTPANGATFASSTVNTVTLRWSRFNAPTTGALTNSLFSVTSLPGFFGFTQASAIQVDIFLGVQGTDGVTNLDGIANGSAPAATPAVGVRALFIEDPANTLTPPYFAAKVRQH